MITPKTGRPKKPSKLRNKKVEIDGIVFDSGMEGRFYLYLKGEKAKARIRGFKRQVVYELISKYEIAGRKVRAMKIKIDFEVETNEGAEIAIDVKGHPTEKALLKRKIFEQKFKKPLQWVREEKGNWVDFDQHKKSRKRKKK